MAQEFQKKEQIEGYDREKMKPVVRNRGRNDAQVAGFVDLLTGEFTEIMRIRGSKDMDEFLEKYDISIADIAKE